MRKAVFQKGQTVKYLIWTFVPAWLIQIGVAWLYQNNQPGIGQLVMALMMFVPMLGVLLAGGKLRAMGWNPHIRKNIKPILIAWFGPAILTALGAVLYFLFFPGHLDLSGSSFGPEVLEQLAAQGISYPVYVLIGAISSLTYAPLLNMLFGLGEEIGWRGFLYPRLKARFGRNKGWLLGGVIWGVWHWPLIWLIGYEYGTDYLGFPIVGMLLFCVFSVTLGILCDYLYERSGCIWIPALFHGSLNASAGIPLAICLIGIRSARLLGPAPVGILSAIPYLAVAIFLLCRRSSPASQPEA